jgi:hypothetical protein
VTIWARSLPFDDLGALPDDSWQRTRPDSAARPRLGAGTPHAPGSAALRTAIGTQAGDEITMALTERL